MHVPYFFYIYSLLGLFWDILNFKLEVFIKSPNFKISQYHNDLNILIFSVYMCRYGECFFPVFFFFFFFFFFFHYHLYF